MDCLDNVKSIGRADITTSGHLYFFLYFDFWIASQSREQRFDNYVCSWLVNMFCNQCSECNIDKNT